jgi:hypothetical protein
MKGNGQAGSAATRKVVFPWWIENDGGLKFEILVILVRVTSRLYVKISKQT